MVPRRYTEWCNISYHSLLPGLSLPPTFHHYFSLSPCCNLIGLDCPLATSPSSHVALCPPTQPPPPFFLLYTNSSRVEVVWLMSSNPISLCSRPAPAGGFSHAIQPDQSEWPLLCTLITVSNTENSQKIENCPCFKAALGKGCTKVLELQINTNFEVFFSQQFGQQNKLLFFTLWSVITVALFLVIVQFL